MTAGTDAIFITNPSLCKALAVELKTVYLSAFATSMVAMRMLARRKIQIGNSPLHIKIGWLILSFYDRVFLK